MEEGEQFWNYFLSKNFSGALSVFDKLPPQQKEEIFVQLFQQGQSSRTPHSVSVLFRELHEGKKFGDFYQAWFPPKEKCNKKIIGEQIYQQFFPAPIRVINAENINDPKQIVSIGLHWLTDEELKRAMSDPKIAKDGAQRGDKISTVADKKHSEIYKVLQDDNLGTEF